MVPLLTAAIAGPREALEVLLDAGADVNAQAPDGSTALMKATPWRHVDIVTLLLARGANAHASDERGWTALRLAKQLNHRELVELLERHA